MSMIATAAEVGEREEQLVAFQLADEIYGVDIFHINEIIRLREITQIPRTSDDVEGVINLRGKIVPILDLRKRLGLPPKEHTSGTRVIIVEPGEGTVGLIVDGVNGVLRIPQNQIEPPSELVSSLEADYVRGVGKQDDMLVILLNLPQVLRLNEKTQ
jgi:purine-binding chemotaxis protein CheW